MVIKVCIPSLVLFETRQDKTEGHFPHWQDRDKTTYVWSHCLGIFGKKGGTKSGPGSGWSRTFGMLLLPDYFGKNQVPGKWLSETQTFRWYSLFSRRPTMDFVDFETLKMFFSEATAAQAITSPSKVS